MIESECGLAAYITHIVLAAVLGFFIAWIWDRVRRSQSHHAAPELWTHFVITILEAAGVVFLICIGVKL